MEESYWATAKGSASHSPGPVTLCLSSQSESLKARMIYDKYLLGFLSLGLEGLLLHFFIVHPLSKEANSLNS